MRIVTAAAGMAYIVSQYLWLGLDRPTFIFFASLFSIVQVISVGIYVWISLNAAPNLLRRVISVSHDYIALTLTLIYGGERFLPFYAVVLRTIVGNGIRFGARHLVSATIAALASLALVFTLSEYWRTHPYVALTLTATAVVVPTYVYSLLGERQRATEAAIAANRAKSQLLAQASHDLRQPIHAISLFTASLREAGLKPGELEMVENIDRSLDSVSRLFRSLLDVSGLDGGAIRPRLEPIPLDALIAETLAQNKRAAEWAGVSLRAVRTGRTVTSDPALLSTMLQNIVSNAIKYAPGKDVLVGARRRGDTLSLQVLDRGRGVAPEHVPKLFDDFYRAVDRGHDIDGVGLGLAIVKRMADLLDLRVAIHSRLGRGTRVAIDGLKIARDVAPMQGRVPRPRLSTPLSGLRILLIDDDAAVLRATTDLLERWGCTVQAERNRIGVIAECDLVITDYDLNTDTTGADWIAAALAVSPQAQAIVLTGHDSSRVRARVPDETIPILMKPLRPSELRSTMVSMALRARAATAHTPASAPLTAAAARLDTPS
ncbi:MAG: hybrid sensor histidine kinase/response regulator [Rhizobiales bacterium]|nr:hybrid sensor histidine kinase/response regulator [Hyphomicrobiales bacterium]